MPQKNSAKFAFFYLLSLVGLLFVSLSTGMIIFQIINKYIVDVIDTSNYFSSSDLKFAISALIISAPVFYLTMKQIYKNLYSGELEKDSGIRKWLSYFVLLVSSVVMIGWLIATLNNFFDGELTTKFILKALTALSIAATIFSFYFYDIKREQTAEVKDKVIKIYFYASLLVIIISFIASLFVVESPTQTRNRKFDVVIINDFYAIDSALNSYYADKGKLPESLQELQAETIYLQDDVLKDSATNQFYKYQVIEDKKYELCATFKSANKNTNPNDFESYADPRWLHEAGYQCIKNKIESIYPMKLQ